MFVVTLGILVYLFMGVEFAHGAPKPTKPLVLNYSNVDQGPYFSDYHRVCRAAYFKPLEARQYCASLGPEWYSAHLAFKKGLDTYYALVKASVAANGLPVADVAPNTWFGCTDEDDEGYWIYKGGRLDETVFYWGQYNTANECYRWGSGFNKTEKYCPWEPRQPENGYSGPGDNGANFGVVWEESPSLKGKYVTGDTYTSRTDIFCTVCERTRCTMGLDCFEPHTEPGSMTGTYWPNCRCKCKPGKFGDRCEFPITVDHGPYVSEYARNCSATPVAHAGLSSSSSVARAHAAAGLTLVRASPPPTFQPKRRTWPSGTARWASRGAKARCGSA